MKKALVALIALATYASSAFAIALINASWSSVGILGHDGNLDGVLASEDTDYLMWDLVWSSSGETVIDTIGFEAATGKYSYREGDEIVSSRLVKTDGSCSVSDIWPTTKTSSDLTYEAWLEVLTGDPSFVTEEYEDSEASNLPKTSGYFYSVIFQYCTDGQVFYQVQDDISGLPVLAKIVGRDPTDNPIEVGFDTSRDITISRYLGTVEPGPEPVIPEPATMSLLGLGALGMVLRRKLRK